MQCSMPREATGCGGIFDGASVGSNTFLASAAATTTFRGSMVAAATAFRTKPYLDTYGW